MRIGQSTDIHRLKAGKGIKIGGILIPCEFDTIAHSDGDALLHAIAEAILGALGEGDLGEHFSDQDSKYNNYDSKEILTYVKDLLIQRKYNIVNIDSLILLEKPKLATYKKVIRENVAKILNLSVDRVNIKATTGEKVDAIGRSEAMACEAVVLLQKKE